VYILMLHCVTENTSVPGGRGLQVDLLFVASLMLGLHFNQWKLEEKE